jgi:DNA-binding NtrC family response regulator
MSKARVLIVERDDSVCLTIQHMLESQGHEVIAVQWANAAFEPLATMRFDIAFIGRGDDIFQPRDVLAWIIRATCPDIALILMSGRGQVGNKPGPFDRVLFKPFSIDQIQQVVDLSMQRPYLTPPPHHSQAGATHSV